jgi:type II secretion system protein D
MLDNVELVTAKVQVFQLRNADAEKMKTIVEELLKGATSRAGGQGQGQTTRLVLGEGGGAAGPAAAGEAGAAVDLTFSVDTRTNSLIAAGSPANLRTVEDLVYKLDYTPMEDRIFRVVHLLNAKADDIETAMQAYFDKEAQRHSESAGQGESKARQIEREVTVQSAGETQNTILLSYSPRMESAVFQMIKELDLPPPQVMIQVLMAEVTLDDRLEMGMEFALQDLTFSEHSFVDGHGVLQGAHFDKIFGTDVGAQGQSSLGGISFTITGEDFNFLVRALQTEGRLEVLNRPAILVQDNQEANFTVGESIPIVSQITVSTGGVVTPSVDYQDVGIKLLVTPIINPDGFVNMEIETEISSVAPSSISVGSGVSLPILSKRNARTSVTVKDGETIIIGGLITNRETDSENKVPLAGDIPILGNLFRATVKTHTKTELLMVLTPHVIRDAEQARRMSIAMRDQTGLMDNARRSPMMNSLQVKPDEELFGPAEPTTGPAPGEQGEPYGPLPDEYGPPVGAMQKGEEPNTLTLGPPRSLSRSAKPPAGK